MARKQETEDLLPMSQSPDVSRPLWLVLAPAIFLGLWSGGYAMAKIGLLYAPPMALLALRFGSVVVIMAVLFLVLRPPLPKTSADWMHLVIVGVLIQTVYFGMSYLAFVRGVSAGVAALIMSLQPILVALIAPVWAGERVGWRRWAGLMVALLGTVMVILSRLEIGPPPLLGFALAAIALLGITLGSLWEKRFGLDHHPVTANLIGYAAGLLALLPFVAAEGWPAIIWHPEFLMALAYLVIGNSVIALGLLLAMIRAGEVARVSSLLFLVPPLAAAIAWYLLGEEMPPVAWLGLLIAGGGVYLATRSRAGP